MSNPRGQLADTAHGSVGGAPLALGIDLGTSSAKASTIDQVGRVVGRGSATYPLHRSHDGGAESDPEDWWHAIKTAVRMAVGADTADIAGIGLSGQMHGVVLVDSAGAALRPAMLWPDRRATAEADEFRRLPDSALARLANPIAPGMAGPMLLWLQHNDPVSYGAASAAIQPKDWVRLRLTGVVGAEPSDASATLLFDFARNEWDQDVVRALGLRESLLGELSPSGSLAGELRDEAAAELALNPGIPVAFGAADTAAALLGSGVRAPGGAQLSVGSGVQLAVVTDDPIRTGDLNTQLFRTAQQEGWYAMAAMQNGGLALERALEWLGVAWDEAYLLAEESPRGANGVLFLPYVTGERTPYMDPKLRGAWLDLSQATHRADLVRAALEGVALAVKAGLEALRAGGHNVERAVVTGGGSERPMWRQMLSDVLGVGLSASEELNPSALGAAMLGAEAAGWPLEVVDNATAGTVEPDVVAAADYEALFDRFDRAVRAQQLGR